jgi:hypothetical protein
MRDRLLQLEIDAPALRGNPLGDPSRRPLLALLPPGRSDGAWHPVEAYLAERSGAEFTHGLCPECAGRHHGVTA